MVASIQAFLSNPHLYEILLIALTSAVIGWVTNWVAIQMTFHPVEFRGPAHWLGWQGIIPSKAEKIAGIVVDRTLSRLGDLSDVFRRLEPELMTRQVIDKINPRMEEIIDQIMEERQPIFWNNVPQALREKVYAWARQQLPKRVEALMAEFGDHIGELVDFRTLVIDAVKQDRGLMNRIFKESGEQEFRFIIRSGFWFGLILGLPLGSLWLWLNNSWLLLIGGFAVGVLTNWIALNIIFRPTEAKQVLGLRLQGLFLRRQAEVAEIWSRLIAAELLTMERIAHAMVNGPYGFRTRAMIVRHIRPALDQAGIFRVVTQFAVGPAGYGALKDALQEKAVSVSTLPFSDASFNKNRAELVGALICERMSALPPHDFQDVLRPAFQEEEWQLILLGGILGMAAGALQYVLVSLLP